MTDTVNDTNTFTVVLTTPSENAPSGNKNMTYLILAIAAALLAFLFGG